MNVVKMAILRAHDPVLYRNIPDNKWQTLDRDLALKTIEDYNSKLRIALFDEPISPGSLDDVQDNFGGNIKACATIISRSMPKGWTPSMTFVIMFDSESRSFELDADSAYWALNTALGILYDMCGP